MTGGASRSWPTRPARPGAAVFTGVDWGGTKIEIVALDDDGKELARTRSRTPRGDYDGCVRTIVDLVEQLEPSVGRIHRVGIGLPGSLDPRTGVAKGASSTWLNGRHVETDLALALRRDIRTANDADCFAVSEATDGAGRGFNVVFGVILGSGAGAGVAVGGQAHHGPNNTAGEWGHNPLPLPSAVELPGPDCYCGKAGCLERWVSGPAFVRDYTQHARIDLAEPVHRTVAEILDQMRAGDRLSSLVWDRYLDRVARGLSVVVNTLDPDVFVLGGGMSNIPELHRELPVRIARYTFSPCFYTPIRVAQHGDSSGVRGAAMLWKETQT